MNLNDLKNTCHKAALQNGWHEQPRTENELLMLVITELSEAVEAERQNHFGRDKDLECLDPETSHFKQSYQDNVKDTALDEITDAVIRVFDIAGLYKIHLENDNTLVDGLRYRSARGENLASLLFDVCKILSRGVWHINDALSYLLCLCKAFRIDIEKRIELKLAYNKLRGKKHGKTY